MNRITVLNDLVQQKSCKNYLEIGVETGFLFFKIKADKKIAVDPQFSFGKVDKYKQFLNFPYNLKNKYFEIPSDDFFTKHANSEYKETRPDLVFVDGMHEYKYALRDIENSLEHLSQDGIIVVHDCNPQSKFAACSHQEYLDAGAKGIWNGDAWKAIVDLRSRRNDLNIFVLDCDHGLGVITRGKPENMLNLSQETINGLTYEDMAANREKWLNLKPTGWFYSYFNIKDNSNSIIRKIARKVLKGQ